MTSQPRPRSRLALEVTAVLIAKFVALALIWSVWFSDPVVRRLGPERIGAVVDSSGAAPPSPEGKHARP